MCMGQGKCGRCELGSEDPRFGPVRGEEEGERGGIPVRELWDDVENS